MTREIKFRGKRVDNGEWVEGDLITHFDEARKIIGHEIRVAKHQWFGGDRYYRASVSVPTIGQFTGLYDKNGVDVYEGDIVRVRNPYDGCWSKDGGEVIFSTDYVGGWVVTSNGKDGLNIGTRTEHIEVIGNIHDNPSRLEVG